MLHSAEIRWFAEGDPDAAVIDEFRRSALAADEEPRIDSYLLLPGCTSAGVKVRQGHLEVKALTSTPEPVCYDNGLSGTRASWLKWSSGIAGAPLLEERKGPETWVQVQKARMLRLFDLGSGGPLEVSPAEWLDGTGCYVELARLCVTADTDVWSTTAKWWSVCFEAFGGESLTALDAVASLGAFRLLGDLLTADASMGYPEWLSRNSLS